MGANVKMGQVLPRIPLNHMQNVATRRPSFRKALEIDFTDSDTQIASVGIFLGVFVGVGVPIFYINREEADEKRLDEIRTLNRDTKEATGEYMSDDEIFAIRPPRWTDRREFVDDD